MPSNQSGENSIREPPRIERRRRTGGKTTKRGEAGGIRLDVWFTFPWESSSRCERQRRGERRRRARWRRQTNGAPCRRADIFSRHPHWQPRSMLISLNVSIERIHQFLPDRRLPGTRRPVLQLASSCLFRGRCRGDTAFLVLSPKYYRCW